MRRMLFSLCLVFIFSTVGIAQIPPTLSYQGVLTDASTNPRNGNFLLTFRFYEQAEGGDAVWQEIHNVFVANGLFSVVLGKDQPLSLAFDKPYWLGITVGGDAELSPRVELTSAAYSLNARSLGDGALTAGSNINLTRQGSTLIISASGGGSQLTLPFSGSVASDGDAMSVANTGSGAVAQFQNNGAAATLEIINNQPGGAALQLQGNLTSNGTGEFAFGLKVNRPGIESSFGLNGAQTGYIDLTFLTDSPVQNSTGVNIFNPRTDAGFTGVRSEVRSSKAAIYGLSSNSSQPTMISGLSPVAAPSLLPDGVTQEFAEAAIWGFTDRDSATAAVLGQNDSQNSSITVGVWGFHRAAGAGVLATNAGTGSALLANHTGTAGNIAVFQSNFTNQARIDKTGKGFFSGGTQTGGADVAEAFAVEGVVQEYEAGDVLVISTDSDRTVEKSNEPYSTRVIGVYATKPGVLLSERHVDASHDDMIPVGVVGVIATKVTGENGAIKRGDLLVTSSRPGYAMKGTERERMLGAIIGKALEEFDGWESGVIRVLVNVK